MATHGISNGQIFVDKVSGKTFDRPAWKKLVQKLRKGDVLYISSIDRLGRNYEEILKWWRILTKDKGVDIVVLDMPLLDTHHHRDLLGTLIADLVLSLFSYVAESERENIQKRQAEGIAAAKARGVKFGRPAIELPSDFCEAVRAWEGGDIKVAEALRRTGLKKATFYRKVKALRIEHEIVM